MATIRVNSTVMREKANAFKTVANSVKTFTGEMLAEMEGLRSFWEGESAETAVAKFKGLSDDFENMYQTIVTYSGFLEQAADAYDKVENQNSQVDGSGTQVVNQPLVGRPPEIEAVSSSDIGVSIGTFAEPTVVEGRVAATVVSPWQSAVDTMQDALSGVKDFFAGW